MKKAHYVPTEKEILFLWTNRGTTACGKIYEKVEEFTSDINYVTCKKCKSKI
jgi:hypothetical protein